MNSYDAALYKVVDAMLAAKKCKPENGFMRHYLVEHLRDKIREIAVRTTNGSNHAGRTVPSFFDLERTLNQMGVFAADLKDILKSTQPPIRCPAPKTRDEDFHKEPEPMLTETTSRVLDCSSYIPDHLPPFPGPHTYKSTPIKKSTEKSYEMVRTVRAKNKFGAQQALNRFYLGSEPNISLAGSDGPKDDIFKVLAADPRQKMSCLDALMPRSEILEKDIYEDEEQSTHGE